MSFAMYLRQLRHARQMPQSRLAVALRVTPKSLVELESGRRVPTIQELQQLAIALNVAERELMIQAGYLTRDVLINTLCLRSSRKAEAVGSELQPGLGRRTIGTRSDREAGVQPRLRLHSGG